MPRQDPPPGFPIDGLDPRSLLEAILSGTTDPVVFTDARGTILRASRACEGLLGWPTEELTGENVRLFIPEPHRSNHDEYLQRYLTTGRTWILGTTREFEVQRRDGTLVPCEICVSRIDPRGYEGPLFWATLRDVTERSRAREALTNSEARFRAVFENANELVLLIDEDGHVQDANRPTYERTATRRADLLGRPLEQAPFWLDRHDVREAVARTLARALEVGVATSRVEVLLIPPGPRGVDADALQPRAAAAEVSVRRVGAGSGDLPRAVVEVRDVSALVAAERRESTVLRSLARVGEEAAMLAHELRSPVSALELALKAVARQLGEDERLLLDDLAARMRRLEDLLRRTLSFSRPLDLQPVAVSARDAFGAALEREAQALERSRVRAIVHVEEGTPPLRADARALDDLLANLVRNACEAQPNGGRVRLSAWPGETGRVELVIEDDGPGIPPAEREDVFRPFRTTKAEGTGLGLALVRKVAEEQEARVRLEDAVQGRGLRVALDWPAAAV